MAIKYNASLKDQVYAHIRDKIINLEYGFGEKINLSSLEKELGVSNTPIREALSMLENNGLIVSVPNVGVKVTPMTREIFNKHTGAISALIVGCYMECRILNREAALIKLLDERFQAQKEISKYGFSHEYTIYSIAFDRSFVDTCENEFLTDMFEKRMDWLMISTLQIHRNASANIPMNLTAHENILDAVRNQDVDRAISLIFSHFLDQPFSVES